MLLITDSKISFLFRLPSKHSYYITPPPTATNIWSSPYLTLCTTKYFIEDYAARGRGDTYEHKYLAHILLHLTPPPPLLQALPSPMYRVFYLKPYFVEIDYNATHKGI